jgi:parvulin-like peptidyl-prolyl isomerase
MKFLMIFISLFIFLNGKVIDSLAILVNEQPITTYDIEKLQKQVKNREIAISILIDRSLLKQEIKRRGIYVDDFDIDKAMQKIAQKNGMSLFNFKSYLLQQGQLESLKERLKSQLEQDKLISSLNIRVSPEDLKNYYETHKDSFKLPTFIDVTQYSASNKKLIEEVIKNPMLNSPELKIKSIKFKIGKINPRLYQYLSSLEEGSFSKIINLSNQFTSFYIEKKGKLELLPFKKVEGKIYQLLMAQKSDETLKELVAKLKAKADIQILELPKK